MKKSLCFVGACMLILSSIFAGPFGELAKNINALDSGAAGTFEGNIPDGQELFPIIYRYTHDEIKKGDKVVEAKIELKDVNVFEDSYTIKSSVYYKYGIGLQCQEATFDIKGEGDKYKVVTTSMANFNVDKKYNRTGDYVKLGTSSMNANSKNVIIVIDETFNNTKGDDYLHWTELGYSDLEIQIGVGEYASNKLKAKKWYENHSLENKNITFKLLFVDINESVSSGRSYEVSGVVSGHSKVFVSFYTDNDKFLDAKKNDIIEVSGIVSKVDYAGQYNTTDEIDLKNTKSLVYQHEKGEFRIKNLEVLE